jgi:FixJ family two-component response regulator
MLPTTTTGLHVVDRDPVIQQGLMAFARRVRAKLDVHRSCRDFLAAYSPDMPACLVVDLTMLGDREFAALDAVRCRHDPLTVVALSANATVPLVVRILKAGAIDFIEKPCGIEELTDAVGGALEVARQLYTRRREQGEFERRMAELSARQREILHHLVLGKANKVIAYELGISERTVEVHRYRLMRRMAVGSAVELARMVGALRYSPIGPRLVGAVSP